MPSYQFLSRFLRGIIYMGVAPSATEYLTDLTPVDFVSLSCCFLLRAFLLDISRFCSAPCFHLWNDNYASFEDVAKCCVDACQKPIKITHYDKWVAKLKESDPKRYFLMILSLFNTNRNAAILCMHYYPSFQQRYQSGDNQ